MTAGRLPLSLSLAFALGAALAGCPGPEARPVSPSPPSPPPPPSPSPAAQGSGAPAEATPREPSQDEQLAAIQKAMNELDEAAQACWAASAAVRFDVEGELVAMIEIQLPASKVTLVRDTTRNQDLVTCVAVLLERYPWAPPLRGRSIQLPFRFRAPTGQNVIDRRLVPWKAQGKVAVAVLFDAQNSGNAGTSMFELAIAAGGATGTRTAERPELWYFLHPATVEGPAAASRRAVAAGDMIYVPAGAARNVSAAADAHAVIVVTPGGREGAARAGALPTPELPAGKTNVAGPVHLPASAARRYPQRAGAVTLFADPSTIRDKGVSGSVIELPKGVAIPEHVHAGETELLYVLAGAGTMTVRGVPVAVTSTSVVQIPPNTPHSFTATEDVRAFQLYTPAGPEQRFKQPPPPPPAGPTPKATPMTAPGPKATP